MRRFSVRCIGCGCFNQADLILCLECWPQLHQDTRERLLVVDKYTPDRYSHLVRLIYSGLPLGEIRIPSYRHLYGSLAKFRDNLDKYLEEQIELAGQLDLEL